MEKRNSQLEHGHSIEQTQGFARTTQVWLATITTPLSLLVNAFDVRSVMHWQVSLAAVNQICVIHEAVNGSEHIKITLKYCFEKVKH